MSNDVSLGDAGVKSSRGNRPIFIATASVALAVIAVTLLAVVMQRVGSQTASIDRDKASAAGSELNGPTARAAMAAAKTEVAATLTYSYKTLQADIAHAEQAMTPAFKQTYDQTMRRQVLPLAGKTQTSSTASVPVVGIKSLTPAAGGRPATATVLVFANQVVRNNQLTTAGRLDRTRIEADLVLVDGHWLISKLTPL